MVIYVYMCSHRIDDPFYVHVIASTAALLARQSADPLPVDVVKVADMGISRVFASNSTSATKTSFGGASIELRV